MSPWVLLLFILAATATLFVVSAAIAGIVSAIRDDIDDRKEANRDRQ